MTDDQIEGLWLHRPNIHDGELMPQLRDFARAIEKASRALALEEAAKVCDERAEAYWKAYKKSPIDRPERANPHVEGMSDGAGNCAAHIRALAKSEGEKT